MDVFSTVWLCAGLFCAAAFGILLLLDELDRPAKYRFDGGSLVGAAVVYIFMIVPFVVIIGPMVVAWFIYAWLTKRYLSRSF